MGREQRRMFGAQGKAEIRERLKAEGRWNQASIFREKTRLEFIAKGHDRQDALAMAWCAMSEAFPPLDPNHPANLERAKAAVEHSELQNIEAERKLVRKGRRQRRPNFKRDVHWVYNNIDNRRCTMDDAPSLGAWTMLKVARDDTAEFFRTFVLKAFQSEKEPTPKPAIKLPTVLANAIAEQAKEPEPAPEAEPEPAPPEPEPPREPTFDEMMAAIGAKVRAVAIEQAKQAAHGLPAERS